MHTLVVVLVMAVAVLHIVIAADKPAVATLAVAASLAMATMIRPRLLLHCREQVHRSVQNGVRHGACHGDVDVPSFLPLLQS